MPIRNRVAVIGCGHWGKNLVRNFGELGALAMICDTSEAGRTLAKTIAPEARIVPDVAQVLESEIEAVVIATPADTHFHLARMALVAGKDVFVEKPLALTYDQGIELAQMADEDNTILMVGHVLEYHPGIVRLVQLVHGETLGAIRYIYSHRLSLGKVRQQENSLWSFAPHDVAVILRLVGSMPVQITACGGSYLQPNIADVTVTHLLFESGVRAHIHVSWLHPFKEQRLVVIGSRKMASFDDTAKRLVIYDQRVDVMDGKPIPFSGGGEDVPYPFDEPLRLECQAFLNAIKTRSQPLSDGYAGARVLRVLEAAQRSLTVNGGPMALPIEASYYQKGYVTI